MREAGPVWLLDVDGVLNANNPGWHQAPHQGRVLADGSFWRFRWAPPVIEHLRTCAHAGQPEIRWATTWVKWAAEVEACFNLPPLPTAFDPNTDNITAAKIEAALHVVETEKRPLIWTDDDVVPTSGPLRERLENSGTPVLLIRPDFRRGLQPAQIAQVQAFTRKHSSGTP